jgi:sugar lactone lactonase YvrE
MKSSQLSSAARSGSLRRPFALTAILCGLSLAAACSDDDDGGPTGGNGGSGGGRAGAAGAAGRAGASGAAGAAGAGGAAGAAGAAGAGGSGAGNGPTGTISVLNADATALNFPTTAAIRGTDLWVVNGQLNAIGGTPTVPFQLVSVPLAGGAVGATRIALPGNDFFPEGIAAAADGTLYVGSATLGSILRVPAAATVPDADEFVEASVAERGVVGLTVDATRDRLWFCDSSPADPTGGALVGVNLVTGLEEVRHAMPNREPAADADAGADAGDAGDAGAAAAAATFCNDVIVAPNGNLFATDSSGRVFRVLAANVNTANSATVWLDSPAITVPGSFGANGLDLVGNTLIIASNGGLVAVDPASNTPAAGLRTISLTEAGAAATLCGPDGLQAVPNTTNQLVVVENGSCPAARERVVKVTLNLD